MDVRSTGIIGRASAVRINYRKWVGASIDTIERLQVTSEGYVIYFRVAKSARYLDSECGRNCSLWSAPIVPTTVQPEMLK